MKIGFLLIYIFSLILCGLLSKKKYRYLFTPQFIFTAFWCISGGLASINPLDLLTPSNSVHYMAITLILVFNLVCFCGMRRGSSLLNNNESGITNISTTNRYGIVYFFLVVGILLLIPNTIQVIKMYAINGIGLDVSRLFYSQLTQSRNFIYVFLTCNVPGAMFKVAALFVTIDLVMGRKKLLFPMIIYLVMLIITYGGRSYILSIAIYYIISYIVLKKENNLPGKIRKIKKRYIILVILVLYVVTMSRGGAFSFFDWFVVYFSGSFSFLEYIITHPELYGINQAPLWGYLTFGCIIEPFILLVKVIFGADIDVPSFYFNEHAQVFVNIGTDGVVMFNNNTTWIYTFLRDWGVAGVAVGTFIIAIVTCLLVNSFRKGHSLRSLCYTCIIYETLVQSTMSYNMTSVSMSLVLIFVLVLTSKVKIKI